MKKFTYCTTLCQVAVVLFSVLIFKYHLQSNNVCKTFEDYYSDRDNNENCYYNPNTELSTPEIIQRHGYPVEIYKVTTDDGYILTVFRIPHGRNFRLGKSRKPVFIQHGMAINSAAFVNTNEKSLAFILADAGYDVWLGNFRGNRYSRNHTYLDPNESEFWEFSFHELGVYDLPAQIELVYNITNQRVVYMGYSMGSTAGLVYGTIYSKDAFDKIEAFINLAPAVFMEKSGFVFRSLAAVWPLLKGPLQVITNGEYFPKPSPHILYKLLCSTFPFQMKSCHFWEMLIMGINFEQNDPETLPITLQQNSDVASIKTLTHVFQMVFTKKFHSFDYGEEYNIKVYGSPNPPMYNFSNILVPSYSFVARNDLGASEANGYLLDSIFRKENKFHKLHVIEYEKFNHFDFLHAKDVVPLLYSHVLDVLNQL